MHKFAAAVALLWLLATAAIVCADDRWGDKLFKGDLVCDFGTVAHGAELYHRFKITNIYKVPLDITDLRVSCGCVTATAPQKTIPPSETGYIEVRMDTTRFTGLKQVTVFVSVSGDNGGYYSSAELKVSANIRQDVVFNPGQIDFGAVNQGDTVTKNIDIDYAGSQAATWKITEVNTNNAPVEASIKETNRIPPGPGTEGRVSYKAVITMKKDASVGAIKQEILFKTNDPASPIVPAFVLATVQSAVNVNPAKLPLGSDIVLGSEIVKRVVVRSNKAIKILGVEGDDDEVKLDTLPSDARESHQLVIHCKPAKAGDFKRTLKIKTDAQSTPVEVNIEGTVQP